MLSINKIKHLKLFIIALLSVIYSTTFAADSSKPDWYGNLPVEPGFIYGYGHATDRSKAKQQALSEISESIEVTVVGTSNLQTSVTGSNVMQASSQEIKLHTEQKLKQVIKLKEQVTEDDEFFLAYKLDLRPSEIRIAEALNKQWSGVSKLTWSGAPWLTSSQFISALTQNIVSQNTNPASSEKKASVKLHRQNNQWILLINKSAHIIWIEDLQRLFAWNSSDDKNFFLELQNRSKEKLSLRLKEGQKFIIKLTNRLKKPGYFTLFNIYPDGRIVLMQESVVIAQDNEFPPTEIQDKGYSLSAELAEPGKEGVDVFLALRTPNIIDTLEYRKVQDIVATGENAFRLHEFLEFLNRAQIRDIATIRVSISPL